MSSTRGIGGTRRRAELGWAGGSGRASTSAEACSLPGLKTALGKLGWGGRSRTACSSTWAPAGSMGAIGTGEPLVCGQLALRLPFLTGALGWRWAARGTRPMAARDAGLHCLVHNAGG